MRDGVTALTRRKVETPCEVDSLGGGEGSAQGIDGWRPGGPGMASRRPATNLEKGGLPVFETNGSEKGASRRGGAGGVMWWCTGREMRGDRVLKFAVIAIFIEALAVGWFGYLSLFSQSLEDTAHYPVVDPHECGSDSQKVLNVFKWMREHGGYIHPNVSTGVFQIWGAKPGVTVRGLRATGVIKQYEEVFRIPPDMQLYIGSVRDDPVLGKVYNETPLMHDAISGLATMLIRESLNKSSFWRPYICSLPDFVSLPLFMSPSKYQRAREDLPAAQREAFDEMVEVRRDIMEVKYTKLFPTLFKKYPDLFPMYEYTYARFAWACSIVMSRTWGRKFRDSVMLNATDANYSMVQTLVPAADMPNHLTTALPANMPNFSVSLRAHEHLRDGDQILISYGKKCSAQFLAHYGFLPYNNSHIPCKVPSHDSTKADSQPYISNYSTSGGAGNETLVQKWRRNWRAQFARYFSVIQKAARHQKSRHARKKGVW